MSPTVRGHLTRRPGSTSPRACADRMARVLSWRRLDANAEGLVDLSAMAADGPGQAIYVTTPVTSPVEQKARLVVDTPASVTGLAEWQARDLVEPEPTLEVEPAPRGRRELARGHVHPLDPDDRQGPSAGQATLVTTFVSAQPVSLVVAKPACRRGEQRTSVNRRSIGRST